MNPNGNGDTNIEISVSNEKYDNEAPNPVKQADHIPVYVNPTSQNSLQNPTQQQENTFSHFLNTVMGYCMNWVKHPMNIALLVWLAFVAAGLLALLLLLTGLVNGAPNQSSQRQRWTEIVNQILNALFTIMCLYQHPNLCHHLVLLGRWRVPVDVAELRRVYCKNEAPHPHERAHVAFVVALLHITCFSQYVLCGLYWGYTSKTRPSWVEDFCIALGITSPVVACVYTIYGPLGWKSESEPIAEACHEEESTKPTNIKQVTSPKWTGGLLDCSDDVNIAYLSFFCTFCVFGWNMERLGFGNMYVHIATFVLLVMAPLCVFSKSALNIDDVTVRYSMVVIGIVLCFLGLLYGGFWRSQMRKKFRLPSDSFCGSSVVADFTRWLFCWSCSLAQEVRTGNFYDIEEDGFYIIETEENAESDNNRQMQQKCTTEIRQSYESSGLETDGEISRPSNSMVITRESFDELLVTIDGEIYRDVESSLIMTPPLPPLIHANQDVKS